MKRKKKTTLDMIELHLKISDDMVRSSKSDPLLEEDMILIQDHPKSLVDDFSECPS